MIVKSMGSRVVFDSPIERICWSKGGVEAVQAGGVAYPAEHFISSIAIRELVESLDPAPPEEVLNAARQLKYREWGIHLTQVATRCCGRAKASTKKRIPRLLLWRGVGLRSASDSRSCRPKAATAMNSRVGRLGGHSHDARNLTFLFRSREATTHRVYLNEVDTPLP